MKPSSLSQSQLGLCPEAASSVLLPLKLGHNKAFELLVLGDTFSGEKAHELGLVNQIVPSESLLDTALSQAERVAGLPNDAVITSRKLMKQATRPQVLQALEEEARPLTLSMRIAVSWRAIAPASARIEALAQKTSPAC